MKENNKSNFFTYILECADGTFYTGYTINLQKRLDKHNSGKGAKYTRSRLPVKIVWFCEFFTKSEAMKKEIAIKKMTRKMKIELINNKKIYEKTNRNR